MATGHRVCNPDVQHGQSRSARKRLDDPAEAFAPAVVSVADRDPRFAELDELIRLEDRREKPRPRGEDAENPATVCECPDPAG
jgi:hypothetical protein